jgi:starch synthase
VILLGHPSGNPNSHHAALAHFEAGRLEAFCVPWMPTPKELEIIRRIPALKEWSKRLERRLFRPLLSVPRVEGRFNEWIRMSKRIVFNGAISPEKLAYEGNDWLMKTMARECKRPSVAAVHSYEDCALWQFEEAKKLGKACIYDMPIGYYPAWEETQNQLVAEFAEWLPDGQLRSRKYVRREQKKMEMQLADLVLGPCSFVAKTIEAFIDRPFALAPYGVDSDFWRPSARSQRDRLFRFIYTGQASIRKGTPLLLLAWERAALTDCELLLVGNWQLSNEKMRRLPPNVRAVPPCSQNELRSHYQSADVFVFPSYFEGFGLVLLEAMACALPVLSSERTAAPDFLTRDAGMIVPAGNLEAWVEALRSVANNRVKWISMKDAARKLAVKNDWQRYRRAVSAGIDQFFS